MEDDAGFENGDVDHVWVGACRCRMGISGGLDAAGTGFGLVPLDESATGIFYEEGQEDTGHEDRRRRRFVRELAEAFVLEHEGGVRKELLRTGLASVNI